MENPMNELDAVFENARALVVHMCDKHPEGVWQIVAGRKDVLDYLASSRIWYMPLSTIALWRRYAPKTIRIRVVGKAGGLLGVGYRKVKFAYV